MNFINNGKTQIIDSVDKVNKFSKLYQVVEYYSTRLPVFMALILSMSVVGTALGFKIVTPTVAVEQVERSQNQLKTRVDSLVETVQIHLEDSEQTRKIITDSLEVTNRLVRALIVGECIDRPVKEVQMMGLPCAELGVHRAANGAVIIDGSQ